MNKLITYCLIVACIIQTIHKYLTYSTVENSLSFKDWAVINSMFNYNISNREYI